MSPNRPELEDLVSRARDDLRAWADDDGPDRGVALVELLAYVGDLLGRLSDQVADEAYLGSARRRPPSHRRGGAPGVGRGTSSLPGVHRVVVVDAADPEGLGRVRVRVPGPGGEPAVWAEACFPVEGIAEVPAVGSSVWVAFEAGDPALPVWLGRVARP